MSRPKPSKSARKREFLALQSLGEKLIALADDQLDNIALDQQLKEAVRDTRSMKSRGALRRQKQLIGKLMRDTDPEPIRAALAEFGRHDQLVKATFKDAEAWRDRIAADGHAALAAFFERVGAEDPALVDDVRAYMEATHDKARKLSRRRIFSAIHNALSAKMQNGARSI